MKVAITKETRAHEKRVAASPETVKKMIALGLEVVIETGAGTAAAFTDAAYQAAGATIAADAAAATAGAELVLKVQRPQLAAEGLDELAGLKPGTTLVAILGALQNRADVEAYAKAGLTTFSMELIPRITRAQSMDVLSSQANLAGYKAVIEAATEYRPCLSDDDDRGRHHSAGARHGHGRRRRRPAGDRHRPPPGRHRLRLRRARGRQGTGRKPGRLVHRGRCRGRQIGRDRRRLRQGNERGLPAPPARQDPRGAEEGRYRDLHRADPGQEGAGAGDRAR